LFLPSCSSPEAFARACALPPSPPESLAEAVSRLRAEARRRERKARLRADKRPACQAPEEAFSLPPEAEAWLQQAFWEGKP
jgi:hypothetical protein